MKKIKYKGKVYVREDSLAVSLSTGNDIKAINSLRQEADRIYKEFSKFESNFTSKVRDRSAATRVLATQLKHVKSMLYSIEEQLHNIALDFSHGLSDGAYGDARTRAGF